MSEKETAKIDKLERDVIGVKHDISKVYDALQGVPAMNIKGISQMLQEHIEQSKRNNDEMRQLFKEFKRDLVKDYADNFNSVEEKQKWVDGRVKVLEETDAKRARHMGFAAGLGVIFGAIFTNIETLKKWFTE